jgi:hypothetical protein
MPDLVPGGGGDWQPWQDAVTARRPVADDGRKRLTSEIWEHVQPSRTKR